jgi:hypothetical protein
VVIKVQCGSMVLVLQNIEIYNDEWLTTVLRTNGTNLDLITKKSKYGKIVAAVSASATASFAGTGTLPLGGNTVEVDL